MGPLLIGVGIVALIAIAASAWLYLQQRALFRRLSDTTQISDLANDPVLVGDVDQGRILYANRAFQQLLGYESSELLSLRIPELHPPDLVGRSAERIAEVWEKKGLIYSDLPLVDAKGKAIDVELSANLVRYGGQPAILMHVRDIRERLRNERAIREHADELERTNQELYEMQAQLVQAERLASLGNLAAGVSHELNSPIGALRSNTMVAERALGIVIESIGSWELEPKAKHAVELLRGMAEANRAAIERVSHIVRSLQNFARLDEAERKRVDLHEGIQSALTLLKHEMKDRITVVCDFGELPQIECSPGKINQVYMNLLTNAIAAIDGPGTISIRSRVSGDRAELSFSDTGRGIAPEILERIFDPTFRSKDGRIRAGLGLPSSYRIVVEHGGSLEVKSELGKGTTVTLKLALDRPEATGASQSSPK